jgi:hypothetical protein
MMDSIPPVGVVVLLLVGCWGTLILAAWGIWELLGRP